jgi:hypothetical protein
MQRKKIEVDKPIKDLETKEQRFCSCVFLANADRYRIRPGMSKFEYCKNLFYPRNAKLPPMMCWYTEEYLNSLYDKVLLKFAINRRIKISPETKRLLIQDIIRFFRIVEEHYRNKDMMARREMEAQESEIEEPREKKARETIAEEAEETEAEETEAEETEAEETEAEETKARKTRTRGTRTRGTRTRGTRTRGTRAQETKQSVEEEQAYESELEERS